MDYQTQSQLTTMQEAIRKISEQQQKVVLIGSQNITQIGIGDDPLPPAQYTETKANPPLKMGHFGAGDGSIFDADQHYIH